ncbi:hypothetical protein CFSAN000515_07670 [Salmonella enterica subsp. enterica serovar Choleraesuis str. CFSAN000515]|uniref:Uncharacterized protein n=2 Tax=Salmonella enterica TaxID=28901 RepID=A0A745RAP6_SALER|nr:hypothetical protein [Salmonella enterica]ECK9451412.1 hypothetical protein [Salmonella enterica subsp. enterica serovar Choleraesuis str. CFSAN000515]HAE4741139.1 hypothetical protein [Salmonella enterica subsp. enterica serovar Choleraesuis]EAW5247750.1 hypothetical protein [Salmonella enterica]HAF2675997.1 hypothetical protein [Salmonella enterica]
MHRVQGNPYGEPESTTLLTLLPVLFWPAFAGFFFWVLFQPGLLVILSPGSARAPHVHLVRSGPCALAVNNLPAPLTPDLEASAFVGPKRQRRIRQRIQHSVSSRFALWCKQSSSKGSSHDLTLRIYWIRQKHHPLPSPLRSESERYLACRAYFPSSR